MAALRAGHFYASTGPEILDVRWEPDRGAPGTADEPAGGTVSVRCSPVRSITLVADATKGGRLNAGAVRHGPARPAPAPRAGTTPKGCSDGSLLTGGEFSLTGKERYARIQVEDELGRRAWTNPLFVRTPGGEGV